MHAALGIDCVVHDLCVEAPFCVFVSRLCVFRATGNSCAPAEVANSDKATSGSITGTTGESVLVACDAGYGGGGVAVCHTNGTFTVPQCTGTVRQGSVA